MQPPYLCIIEFLFIRQRHVWVSVCPSGNHYDFAEPENVYNNICAPRVAADEAPATISTELHDPSNKVITHSRPAANWQLSQEPNHSQLECQTLSVNPAIRSSRVDFPSSSQLQDLLILFWFSFFFMPRPSGDRESRISDPWTLMPIDSSQRFINDHAAAAQRSRYSLRGSLHAMRINLR